MERSDVIMLIYVMIGMALMFASSSFPEPYRSVMGYSAFGLIFMLVIGQDVYASLKSREFKHMWAIVCSFYDYSKIYPAHRFQLWYSKVPRSQFIGTKDGKDWYITTMELEKPIKHPRFGPVRKIKIMHWGQWEERIHLDRGKVVWLDMTVRHSATTWVVLYELVEDLSQKPISMDMLEPIPIYELKWSKKDYDYRMQKIRERLKVIEHA